MITKTILGQLIIEALESNSGSASIVKICQYIWLLYSLYQHVWLIWYHYLLQYL